MNISAVSGFPWADTPKNGLTVIVTARDRDNPASVQTAKDVAVELGQLAWSQLPEFQPSLTPLEGCVEAAQAAAESRQPIVLCDCADNPGAGARGNTTYLLKALLEAGVPRVFAGVFNDAALVEAATAVGEGGTFTAHLNTQEPSQFSEELQSEAVVVKVSDGRFAGTVGMVAGGNVNLGPSVLLELGGPDVALQLVVISRRQQILSTDFFEAFGLSMEDCSTAVVKSRGHFRAGFQHFVPDAGVLEADVPGLSCQNLSRFEWNGLQRPVWPLDAEAGDLAPDWASVMESEGPMYVLDGRTVAAELEAEAEEDP